MRKEEIIGMFFKKPSLILIEIEKNKNTSALSFATKTTFSWCSKVVDVCEKIKFIKTKKKGREKEIEVTDKGKQAIRHIKKVIDLLDGKDDITPPLK